MSAGSSNKRFKAKDFLWCIPLSIICCPCLCGLLMRNVCIDDYKSDATAADKAELDHQETCRKRPPRPVPLIRKRALSSTPGRWSRCRIDGQAQSMLLSKLPQEIRQMIWTLVLGERLLHIVQRPGNYYEAIDILYARNTFDVRRVDAFISLHESIIPQRFDSIRYLNLLWHFERNFFATLRPWFKQIRHDRSRWEEGCAALKSMTGLWDLTLSLHVNWARKDAKSAVKLLEPLKQVTVKHWFEVTVSWPATTNEAEIRFLKEKLPFRLVRDEGMALPHWWREHNN
ncbi:hypothetical protein H2199_005624 [Coniosporium tulheliwenetii]|uniref:Uncharacterized protein n=1 Tax=Coniosporium tulheliwenetii TaxID=3383036 RepID=A0ACC2Z041_9PEZI|nr:hypothetical protein H2199_005624 [Cladosporium sp. JES 115]